MAVALVVVLLLTLANGVLAGAEIAVLSVRKTRLAELCEKRAWGAPQVAWLRKHPERFLATVQVGITVITTTTAAFGGDRLGHDIAARLAAAPWIGQYAPAIGLVVVVAAISYFGIVLGELVPKSLALKHAERYALLVGPLLRAMASATRPAVWLLTRSSNLVLKLARDETSFTETRMGPDELRELVAEAARSGSLDEKTGEITSRALDFRELTAADVMVPRLEMVMLPADASRDDLREELAKHRYARMPVFDGSPDNVVGYVTVRELVLAALRHESLDLREHMRPARFFPASARAAHLLETMRIDRTPMALVVDESGGVMGLVTVEDLVEEVVGEILGEHDPGPPPLSPAADGSIVLPGTMPIREANRACGISLPEPEGYSTLAGLCIHVAGAIPPPRTVLTLDDGTVLEVMDASPRRVRKVKITAPPRPEKAEDDAPEAAAP